MRIWLYTPVLHSATSIMSNLTQARRVVDLAKDTIQYLSHLNNTTNLYRRVQVFYHQFLTSSIAVVFLASVHYPVGFSEICRKEFYMALELVKDLSVKSWVSKRLWRTIGTLKDVAPRFGLDPDEDPHSSAALGMIGLARGHMDAPTAFQKPSLPPSQDTRENSADLMVHNGTRIQSEMSRIFEGYVGLNAFHAGASEEQALSSGPELSTPDSGSGMFAPAGTVFPHFRDLF